MNSEKQRNVLTVKKQEDMVAEMTKMQKEMTELTNMVDEIKKIYWKISLAELQLSRKES